MKVRIAIEQEFDLSDDNIFDEESIDMDNDLKIDYLVNRFSEDMDHMVKYDTVHDAIIVEYVED
jgi:hypothetical protein